MNPFSEEKIKDYYIRKFSEEVDTHELKWHWDDEDRIVVPVEKTNWLFQRENELPQTIDGEIKIKAKEWHRIIKGTGDLVVKIYKL